MTKKVFAVTAILLSFSMFAGAQSIGHGYQPHVALLGNSIAMFEATLQPEIFPQLPAANVYIFGHPSYTCSMVRTLLLFDAFGSPTAPRNPDVVVLVNDTTNDIQKGHTAGDVLTCLQGSVQDLLTHKPTLKVVVLTTPPWTQFNPCTGTNNDPSVPGLIESYNQVMPQLQTQWPQNVRVLDAFTPFLDVQHDGWANPALMGGPCGIHPGQPYTWDFGQPTLAAVFRTTVLTSNQW
jgi:hypothetical protein